MGLPAAVLVEEASVSIVGAAGCCGCSGAVESDKIGPYDPLERNVVFTIPARPKLLACNSSSGSNCWHELPGEHGGVIGFAVNGVPLVYRHLLRNGSRSLHSFTKVFDECGGHGDVQHRYHYHMPPLCLLRALNGTAPVRSNWWLEKNPEQEWPQNISRRGGQLSPLIGWALDGHPIFGPYDPETGVLQLAQQEAGIRRGAGGGQERGFTHDRRSGTSSELDRCNGKILRQSQVYAYFVTPNYPYLPRCLRGSQIGVMSDTPLPNGKIVKCKRTG